MHEYEQTLRFGGGGGDTFINPIGLVLLISALILILVLPRRHILTPFLIVSLLIPMGQRIVIGGLHLYVLRILILFGWIRVLASGWLGDYTRSRIDTAIALWALADTVAFVLLWGEWDAFINRMGFVCNVIGLYFLFRILYRTPKDIDRTIRVLATICCVLGICMINEKITGRNLFWVLGGVPEFTAIREGSLRAQGPFAHPILAGTFAAMFLPLFIGLWWRERKDRWVALLGVTAAITGVVASASSTPIMTAVAGIIGLCFWPLRRNMRVFRWSLVLVLTGLHIVMKAPVWALIARVDIIGGSSGYHRYELVNQFILHFSQWWLVGVKYTSDWGYFMHDVSNQFVGAGTEGGLAGFVLFLWIITCCFQALGNARKARLSDSDSEKRVWSLGAVLFACIASFFGTSFFDQTIVAWYALLAMIAAVTVPATRAQQATAQKSRNHEIDWHEVAVSRDPIETASRIAASSAGNCNREVRT
jgi:hypothetical protein